MAILQLSEAVPAAIKNALSPSVVWETQGRHERGVVGIVWNVAIYDWCVNFCDRTEKGQP